MSTVQKINFELVTDILPIQRRDFPLANRALANASDGANCLYDGEWLTLDSSYKLIRATDFTNTNSVAAKRSFPLWAERGRYDVLAMSEHKMPILFGGFFEADTRIFSLTANGGFWVTINAIMQPLKVGTVTIGSRNFSGLVGHNGSADSDPIVGYVTKLPVTNSGKLRFITGWRS